MKILVEVWYISKLSGLKSRYSSEITPIANAYTAMQEANIEKRNKDGVLYLLKIQFSWCKWKPSW